MADQEFDVVVVGSGGAGMTAALAAAKKGLSVVLVEKAPHVLTTLHVGQQLAFLLVSSLRRDKAESDSAADRDAWRLDQDDTSLASGYDYVMYGKIFKYDERSTEQVSVYGSFGGLLMALTGSFRHLSKITVGANVYLLLR